MEAAYLPPSKAYRGTQLLVEHCTTLGRVTAPRSTDARSRLELELGDDLTRLLLHSLDRRHPVLGRRRP